MRQFSDLFAPVPHGSDVFGPNFRLDDCGCVVSAGGIDYPFGYALQLFLSSPVYFIARSKEPLLCFDWPRF